VNIGEYSPMLTEPEANNCFDIIFRAEQRGIKNNRLKLKNTKEMYMYIDCESIYSPSSAVKQAKHYEK